MSYFKGERFPSARHAHILNEDATRDDKNTLAGRDLSSKTYTSACHSGGRTPKKVHWNNSALSLYLQGSSIKMIR